MRKYATQPFVLGPLHARRKTHDRASVLGCPFLGLREQPPADPLVAVLAINDQTADDDEGLCLDVLGHQHVDPSDGALLMVSDEELLVRAGQHTRQAVSDGRRFGAVAEL